MENSMKAETRDRGGPMHQHRDVPIRESAPPTTRQHEESQHLSHHQLTEAENPNPTAYQVWKGAISRIQTQVTYNTSMLEAQRRQLTDLDMTVKRLVNHELPGIVQAMDSLQNEIRNSSRAPPMERSRHDPGDLDVLLEQVASVTTKANEVDELKLQIRLMKNQMKRMEEAAASPALAVRPDPANSSSRRPSYDMVGGGHHPPGPHNRHATHHPGPSPRAGHHASLPPPPSQQQQQQHQLPPMRTAAIGSPAIEQRPASFSAHAPTLPLAPVLQSQTSGEANRGTPPEPRHAELSKPPPGPSNFRPAEPLPPPQSLPGWRPAEPNPSQHQAPLPPPPSQHPPHGHPPPPAGNARESETQPSGWAAVNSSQHPKRPYEDPRASPYGSPVLGSPKRPRLAPLAPIMPRSAQEGEQAYPPHGYARGNGHEPGFRPGSRAPSDASVTPSQSHSSAAVGDSQSFRFITSSGAAAEPWRSEAERGLHVHQHHPGRGGRGGRRGGRGRGSRGGRGRGGGGGGGGGGVGQLAAAHQQAQQQIAAQQQQIAQQQIALQQQHLQQHQQHPPPPPPHHDHHPDHHHPHHHHSPHDREKPEWPLAAGAAPPPPPPGNHHPRSPPQGYYPHHPYSPKQHRGGPHGHHPEGPYRDYEAHDHLHATPGGPVERPPGSMMGPSPPVQPPNLPPHHHEQQQHQQQQGDQPSQTPTSASKKTRTKPIRNAEGVLIRKDGRPDMRSVSSANNLRKVHAKKETENGVDPYGVEESPSVAGASAGASSGFAAGGNQFAVGGSGSAQSPPLDSAGASRERAHGGRVFSPGNAEGEGYDDESEEEGPGEGTPSGSRDDVAGSRSPDGLPAPSSLHVQRHRQMEGGSSVQASQESTIVTAGAVNGRHGDEVEMEDADNSGRRDDAGENSAPPAAAPLQNGSDDVEMSEAGGNSASTSAPPSTAVSTTADAITVTRRPPERVPTEPIDEPEGAEEEYEGEEDEEMDGEEGEEDDPEADEEYVEEDEEEGEEEEEEDEEIPPPPPPPAPVREERPERPQRPRRSTGGPGLDKKDG